MKSDVAVPQSAQRTGPARAATAAQGRLRAAWSRLEQVDARFTILVTLILLIALAGYLYNLTGWLINDDEGSYLYQGWRISLGEFPYRDFLTPQLPVFLYSGGLLMRAIGPSVEALRTLSVLLTILSAAFLYLTARRATRPGLAVIAVLVYLLYPDLYAEGRVYRPEPFQMFFDSVAVYVFLRAHQDLPDQPVRRYLWFAAAGVLFGLAMLSKLFGVLPLGAVGLFLLYLAVRGKISWRRFGGDVLALGLPFVGVVAGVMVVFYLVTPNVLDAVLLHHLRQGSSLSRLEVARKGLAFFAWYFQSYTALLLFAIPAAWLVLRRRRDPESLFVWFLPPALIFLFLSRELWTRHLLYLAPALAVLLVIGLEHLLDWEGRAYLPWAIIGAVIVPWYYGDSIVANYTENGTQQIADFIAGQTAPGEYVLADYSELNFYARRPTGYAAAALSAGAAESGQITGEELIAEMEAHDARLVLIDTSIYSQLLFLHDYADFRQYVETRYDRLGTFLRHNQEFVIYRAKDSQSFPPVHNFADRVNVLSADILTSEVASGGSVTVRASWQARQDMDTDYVAFLHLVDGDGHVWGQGDGPLATSRRRFTSTWDPADIAANRYEIQIRSGTPPGVYHVRLGIYGRRDEVRLDLLNADGNPIGTYVDLGQVRVSRPPTPPDPSALELQHVLDERMGDRVRLLGFTVGRNEVQAGDNLFVTLGWQALRALDGEQTIRLALRTTPRQAQDDASDGDGGTLGGEMVVSPGAPGFPTQDWRQGDVVVGQHELLVDAAAAGLYTLSVTWQDSDGQSVAGVALTTIEVQGLERQFEVPPIPNELDAKFGDRINLLGYDIDRRQLAPGGTINITLLWQAAGPVTDGYTVFAHLVGDAERIWAQRDHIPAAGVRPTTSWLPGEVVVDKYTIEVPAEVPAGEYHLFAGLYDPRTSDRLPAVADGEPVPHDRVLLETVAIGR